MNKRQKRQLLIIVFSIIAIGSAVIYIIVFNFGCWNIFSQTAQNACYTDRAIEKQDPTICQRMPNKTTKDACYYFFVMNYTSTVKNPDPTVCDKISNQSYIFGLVGQSPKDACYYRIALVKQDSTVCDNIVNQNTKDYCSALATNDSTLCDGISDQYTKNYCYYYIALEKKYSSLCDKISDQYTKNECHYLLAQ